MYSISVVSKNIDIFWINTHDTDVKGFLQYPTVYISISLIEIFNNTFLLNRNIQQHTKQVPTAFLRYAIIYILIQFCRNIQLFTKWMTTAFMRFSTIHMYFVPPYPTMRIFYFIFFFWNELATNATRNGCQRHSCRTQHYRRVFDWYCSHKECTCVFDLYYSNTRRHTTQIWTVLLPCPIVPTFQFICAFPHTYFHENTTEISHNDLLWRKFLTTTKCMSTVIQHRFVLTIFEFWINANQT